MSTSLRLAIDVAYLVAATLFIVGLKRLSSPATARSGNALGAVGMLIAILATLLVRGLALQWIFVGLVLGSGIGAYMARAVKMTAMPQMVGVLNGFGGGASLVVAVAEYLRAFDQPETLTNGHLPLDVAVTMALSILVGGVTLSGSAVAAGKLQEIITGRAVVYPMQKTVNALLFTVVLAVAVYLIAVPDQPLVLVAFIVLALVLGVLLVIPIGGADMPVVVSLLNSYSGIAGAMTGFVLHNNLLIIAGALVGA
jgi:H+-translocating NAD(P) transhydrogenase subunit beta